jgi:hypothetical protein
VGFPKTCPGGRDNRSALVVAWARDAVMVQCRCGGQSGAAALCVCVRACTLRCSSRKLQHTPRRGSRACLSVAYGISTRARIGRPLGRSPRKYKRDGRRGACSRRREKAVLICRGCRGLDSGATIRGSDELVGRRVEDDAPFRAQLAWRGCAQFSLAHGPFTLVPGP